MAEFLKKVEFFRSEFFSKCSKKSLSKQYLHAKVTRAGLDWTASDCAEVARQVQWNSPKYSSTLSLEIWTEASVYLSPVSGSTWLSTRVGAKISELH